MLILTIIGIKAPKTKLNKTFFSPGKKDCFIYLEKIFNLYIIQQSEQANV
jgi:hypothetical protein